MTRPDRDGPLPIQRWPTPAVAELARTAVDDDERRAAVDELERRLCRPAPTGDVIRGGIT